MQLEMARRRGRLRLKLLGRNIDGYSASRRAASRSGASWAVLVTRYGRHGSELAPIVGFFLGVFLPLLVMRPRFSGRLVARSRSRWSQRFIGFSATFKFRIHYRPAASRE
jgi:hypothetical protein